MKKINVILAVIAVMVLSSCTALSYSHFDRYTRGEGVINDPIESIDVEWVKGSVEILYDENVKGVEFFEECGKELGSLNSMYWWFDGHKLRIKCCSPDAKNKQIPNKKLCVRMPMNSFYNAIYVDGTSTYVKMDVDCNDIQVDTYDGDVEIFTYAHPTAIDVKTTSGDVYLHLPVDSSFDLWYATDYGKLFSDFRLLDGKDGWLYTGNGIYNTRIEVETSTGDLKITVNL